MDSIKIKVDAKAFYIDNIFIPKKRLCVGFQLTNQNVIINLFSLYETIDIDLTKELIPILIKISPNITITEKYIICTDYWDRPIHILLNSYSLNILKEETVEVDYYYESLDCKTSEMSNQTTINIKGIYPILFTGEL